MSEGDPVFFSLNILNHVLETRAIKFDEYVPSGNLLQSYGSHGPFSSLIYHDLPIKDGDFP